MKDHSIASVNETSEITQNSQTLITLYFDIIYICFLTFGHDL